MELHHTRTTEHHRQAGLLVAIGAFSLAACTLDTAPESTPSRAAQEAEAESSTLDRAAAESAAGAPAPVPASTVAQTAPQPAAAVIAPALPQAQAPEEPTPAAPAQDDAKEPMAAAAEKPADEEREEPTDESVCKPGDYEGVIAGTLNLGPLELSTLTGTISLRLVTDDRDRNLLRVQQGRVEGVDLNDAAFTADITGDVDCATGELVQSKVERGMYADTTQVIRIGFAGVADGHYSSDPPALLGTWAINDGSTLIAGQGTWTTTLATPDNR